MRASSPMARYCATKLEQLLGVESFGTAVTVGPHGDALPEGVDQAGGERGREQVRLRGLWSLSLSSTGWSSKVRPS